METSKFVVHCKRSAYHVYIGRPGPWGNPFVIGKDGDRIQVIEKFRAWFFAPEQQKLRERAKQELKGKVLACWCAPLACHGHIISKFVNEE